MKIMTKELLNKLPKIGAQDGAGNDMIIYMKVFLPWVNWTWYIAEYDQETGECFGLVEGHEKELGYFSLPELMEIKGPFGLKLERDRLFEPCKVKHLMN